MSITVLWWLPLLVLYGCMEQAQAVWDKSVALDIFAPAQILTSQSTSYVDKSHVNGTLATVMAVNEDPLAASAAASLTPGQHKLSRGKRFVAFPVGSSFSTAVCLTTGVIGNPNLLYLSFGLNWGIAYELPNITWVLKNVHGFGTKKGIASQIKRRHRRDLYGRLEAMMNSHLTCLEGALPAIVPTSYEYVNVVFPHMCIFWLGLVELFSPPAVVVGKLAFWHLGRPLSMASECASMRECAWHNNKTLVFYISI